MANPFSCGPSGVKHPVHTSLWPSHSSFHTAFLDVYMSHGGIVADGSLEPISNNWLSLAACPVCDKMADYLELLSYTVLPNLPAPEWLTLGPDGRLAGYRSLLYPSG